MAHTKEDVKRIATYIKKEEKAGYDVATVRSFLIKQGYDNELVNEAVDSLYHKKFVFTGKHKNALIISAVVMLFLILGGVGFYLIGNEDVEQIIKSNSQSIKGEKTQDIQKENKIIVLDDSGEVKEKINEEIKKGIKEPIPEKDIKEEINKETSLKVNSKEIKKEIVYLEDCDSLSEIDEKDQCILSFAYTETGYEFCADIKNTAKQNLCRSIGRTRERMSAESLSYDFEKGDIVDTKLASEDSILLNDIEKLNIEIVEEELLLPSS